MTTSRKTIEVEYVLDLVNSNLKRDDLTPEQKEAMFSILDSILFHTNQYAGFSYLDSYDANDPEFKIGGKKSNSRQYFMKTKTFTKLRNTNAN